MVSLKALVPELLDFSEGKLTVRNILHIELFNGLRIVIRCLNCCRSLK